MTWKGRGTLQSMRYVDRRDAGRMIAPHVAAVLEGTPDPLILGVPRGGAIVAGEVAIALEADFDLALARKIGAPGNPELAIGAIGEGGDPFLNQPLIERLGVPHDFVAAATQRAANQLVSAADRFRRGRKPVSPTSRVVVVIDDGIATGATLLATIRLIRDRAPDRLVCAVPVAARESAALIGKEVDEFVCPNQPRFFRAVGEWYDRFDQTTDQEVIEMLDRLWKS